ncbi:hypothetical protein [Alistipes indistinctus]|uniref:hypothetical protein n=1 Tax=Alistipes indistinctus TaxID=626932 RepID=UPI0036F24F97
MDAKLKIDDLKARYMVAQTDAEREAVFGLIRAEIDKDTEGVAVAALAQIEETNERAREIMVRNRTKDDFL